MTHRIITLDHYLGPYKDHPQMRSAVLLANAHVIIGAMNEFCQEAERDGVELEDNPEIGSAIAGQGNGGARPSDATVGAALSQHKNLNGLDRYDVRRRLMTWALTPRALEIAERLKLYFEHPQWTRSWVHGQSVPPGSGNRFFVPYSDLIKYPPTCAALPGQKDAGVPVFAFKEAKERKS